MDRWCADRGGERGAVLSLPKCLRLAERWYAGHLADGWRRRTSGESQAIFEEFGLTTPFWRLTVTE